MNSPVAIDICSTLHTPKIVAARGDWYREFLREKIGARELVISGVSTDDYIELMDAAGVAMSFLVATKEGSADHRIHFHTPMTEIVDAVEKHSDRYRGIIGYDPSRVMASVRDIERAVGQYSFIGAHVYPHWFGLEPDDRLLYPLYAKCAELDVPVQLQMGHCLRYSADRPLRSTGYPRSLDAVACDFPDLKIVGIHMGYPWVEEMISVAWKHPNVFVCGDAYAPKYWPESFVRFVDSWGRGKAMFGTDFPVIEPTRMMTEIASLSFRVESLNAMLFGTAEKVYGVSLQREIA